MDSKDVARAGEACRRGHERQCGTPTVVEELPHECAEKYVGSEHTRARARTHTTAFHVPDESTTRPERISPAMVRKNYVRCGLGPVELA